MFKKEWARDTSQCPHRSEAMYLRALQGKERALGAEHTSTLDTINNLGNLYNNQGKMTKAEAEAMYHSVSHQ